MSRPQSVRNAHIMALRRDLDACGHPWHAVNGKKHAKIYIRDKLALVVSHGKVAVDAPRTLKNARAHIRRAVRELS